MPTPAETEARYQTQLLRDIAKSLRILSGRDTQRAITEGAGE